MHFKKLVLVLPIALLLLLHFSKHVTSAKHRTAFRVDTAHKLISASDYYSPHSGKIQTAIEIYSQTSEPQHEFKKNQYLPLTSTTYNNFNSFKRNELKQNNRVVPLIPFYISYCTIMV